MAEKRPITKAQREAVQRYVSKNYDRVVLTMAKGYREDTLKPAAERAGESVNGYIKKAIQQRIDRES